MSIGQLLAAAAPYGWNVLAACVVGLLAGGVGLRLVMQSEGRKPATLAALVPIACLALVVGTALDGVATARAVLVDVPGDDPSSRVMRVVEAVGLQLALLVLSLAGGMVLFLLIGGVLVAPSVQSARRQRRAWAPPLLVSLGLSVAPLYVAGHALGYVWRMLGSFAAVSGVAPADKTALILARLTEGAAELAEAQRTGVWLAIGGAVVAVVGAAWIGRAGTRASQVLLAGAGALWIAGFGAWVGTRAMAKDRAPLPATNPIPLPQELEPPRFTRCASPLPKDASQLWFEPEGRAVLDGQVVDLAALGNRTRARPSRDVVIVAGASTPLARVLPYLAVLHDAGARAIGLAANREDVKTATVGTIHRTTACGVPLAPLEAKRMSFATWGELAAAVQAGGGD